MRTSIIALAFWFAGSFLPVLAGVDVSVGLNIQSPADFHDSLGAQGSWVHEAAYGDCWRPSGVSADWRPYCNGNWEWTDRGWYWVSDEPWAWACYHYGNWISDPSEGWVWIPGVQWAPAWVNWRTGGNYIGWAPCGPSGYAVRPDNYVFVQGRHFNDHLRRENVIVNNITIINKTTEIRNVTREQRQVGGRSETVMVNRGPEVATVERVTGHKYTAVPVREVNQATYRSAPEKLKQPMSDRRAPAAASGEARPAHESPLPAGEPARTSDFGKPQQDVSREGKAVPREPAEPRAMPVEKNLPPDRTFPQAQPERDAPQIPSQGTVRPSNSGLPGHKETQNSKEIMPSGQPAHRPPAGTPAPKNQSQDKDHKPPGSA